MFRFFIENCNSTPHIQKNPLNTCSPIGWKWAQREDAEWMMEDFIVNNYSDRVWGLTKEEVKE